MSNHRPIPRRTHGGLLVPRPGGDDHNDDECEPLTPREESSMSTVDSNVVRAAQRAQSYLHYFRADGGGGGGGDHSSTKEVQQDEEDASNGMEDLEEQEDVESQQEAQYEDGNVADEENDEEAATYASSSLYSGFSGRTTSATATSSSSHEAPPAAAATMMPHQQYSEEDDASYHSPTHSYLLPSHYHQSPAVPHAASPFSERSLLYGELLVSPTSSHVSSSSTTTATFSVSSTRTYIPPATGLGPVVHRRRGRRRTSMTAATRHDSWRPSQLSSRAAALPSPTTATASHTFFGPWWWRRFPSPLWLQESWQVAHHVWRHYLCRPSTTTATLLPMSPRSKNLADLDYLTRRHQAAMRELRQQQQQQNDDDDDDAKEEAFDFCLVLQPQEVYAFWAQLLDFRPELLAHDDLFESLSPSANNNATATTTPRSINTDSPSLSFDPDEAQDVVTMLETPQTTTGLHQRHVRITTIAATATWTPPASAASHSMLSSSQVHTGRSSSTTRRSIFDKALLHDNRSNLAGIGGSSPAAVTSSALLDTSALSMRDVSQHTPSGAIMKQQRRRWGNQYNNNSARAISTTALTPGTVMSPPVRSLTRGNSSRSAVRVKQPMPAMRKLTEDDTLYDANVLTMDDIPQPVIPRGIALKNCSLYLQFLSGLRRGLVVRRHRPGQVAQLVQLVSPDGGDTIHVVVVAEPGAAWAALHEQRLRYNANSNGVVVAAQPWSLEGPDAHDEYDDDNDENHRPGVVDGAKPAEAVPRKHGRFFGQKVTTVANKVVVNRPGTVKVVDMVALHPARHTDPRAAVTTTATTPTVETELPPLGTSTLRRSKSNYSTLYTFSVVSRQAKTFRPGTTANKAHVKQAVDEAELNWYKGEGSETSFRYLDLEAATEGEYWLISRGFLLLRRDAANGRFAAQRAAGIGSHYSRLELEQREKTAATALARLHEDEFHEPVTVGCLERLIVQYRELDTTYMEGYTLPQAVPPPSDYFLGFRSPGTSIWSRLRWAGFVTQRVYSLDPRRVMIKLSCPPDRLMDVAEVLRIKLKTKDGRYAPFREDSLDLFESLRDGTDVPFDYGQETALGLTAFAFRSSIRQTIIDFIIGSRIRDSGSELGQTTELGKMIMARVPLHMPDKLDAIYDSWVPFWKAGNWHCRDGRSLSHTVDKKGLIERTLSATTESTNSFSVHLSSNSSQGEVPRLWKRLVFGSFYQPLDSIEQYFGEKVAFYFAWLQHTAAHLVVLSAAGLLLFVAEVGSENIDHPLRPYFAMFVMLWTFVVLLNWRKRANFLAYRWGTMNYKEQETTRPQFSGEYTRDEITGEWVVTYPKWKRWLKYSVSFPLTLFFTCGALLLIMWVHANRDLQLANYLKQKQDPGSGPFNFQFTLSAIGSQHTLTEMQLTRENMSDIKFWFIVVGMPTLLGISLPLFNLVLMRISVMLNDFENYRTESEYRSYLIVKVFSFRFVCYFGSLYYYAFVCRGDTMAIEAGIFRVGTGVLVYTTVAHWWQNALQIYFPILLRTIRMRHRRERMRDELRELELEEEDIGRLVGAGASKESVEEREMAMINKRLLLDQAQDDLWLEVMLPLHDSFPEYIQAVVLFTFVSCFSVVLPITPLIALINYLIGMRLDAHKICRGRRRPLAEKTGGIGVWEHLLHIVAVISVLTNCWLMGFTSSQFTWIGHKFGELSLFAIVVGWEHVMLLIKFVMESTISPLPKSVRDDVRREQYELEQKRNSTMRARRSRHARDRGASGDVDDNQSATSRQTTRHSITNELTKNVFVRRPLLAHNANGIPTIHRAGTILSSDGSDMSSSVQRHRPSPHAIVYTPTLDRAESDGLLFSA